MQATVGAGLPVLSTLQGLMYTGDKVEKIEGIFSGTLSFIFNKFGPGLPFSEVVSKAKAAGFTEPDPRDDLSGSTADTQCFTPSNSNHKCNVLQLLPFNASSHISCTCVCT